MPIDFNDFMNPRLPRVLYVVPGRKKRRTICQERRTVGSVEILSLFFSTLLGVTARNTSVPAAEVSSESNNSREGTYNTIAKRIGLSGETGTVPSDTR